jgi:hypothetical protein
MTDLKVSRGLLELLAQAPDDQLGKHLTKELQELLAKESLTDDEVKKYLWNTLDRCVRYSWGSVFVIRALELMVLSYPETEEEKESRREEMMREESC